MTTPNEDYDPEQDQDAEPPTPTGEEPDPAMIDPHDTTPGSHPDPPPEGDTGGL